MTCVPNSALNNHTWQRIDGRHTSIVVGNLQVGQDDDENVSRAATARVDVVFCLAVFFLYEAERFWY